MCFVARPRASQLGEDGSRMHHGSELTVVTVVCFALLVGAAILMFSKRTKLPFTILMMSLGLLTGLLLEGLRLGEHDPIARSVGRGAVSSDLILFVFLPALVFESAYSLEVHAFLKNIWIIVILAVPALVVAAGLTALAMVGITASSWQWGLSAALVWGALISATDPVAVVAVLKEAGAPKSLAVLIEGESLLNDGTAIVLFTVLVGLLLGADAAPLKVGLRFLLVVAGGVGVGLILAMAVSAWLGRTFDDPMVEITLTVALAYAAMILAEGMLHVSGVLAVVTAGLWMKGPGRTRISPEVGHFLHQFWELLAYIANTLIFYLVGLVIAGQLDQLRWSTLLIIVAAYATILVVRALVTFVSLPILKRLGDSVSNRDATVMSWGGLRGAVSLALALMIVRNPEIDPALAAQMLQATAGVVLLTIFINGSTTGRLLSYLRFDVMPPSEHLAYVRAKRDAVQSVEERVGRLSRLPDLRAVQWSEVKEELAQRRKSLLDEERSAQASFEASDALERRAGLWQHALSIERHAYHEAFHEGTLGAAAFAQLEQQLDVHHDRLRQGLLDPPDSRIPTPRGLRRVLGEVLATLGGRQTVDRLGHDYDLARAERHAAMAVREALARMTEVDPEVVREMDETYAGWESGATQRIEEMRLHLIEVTTAVETRLARRVALNMEKSHFAHLLETGELGPKAGSKALADVQTRLAALHFKRVRVALAETADLCRETPLFAGLDRGAIEALAEMTLEQAFVPGQTLFKQGEKGDAMYIIARGTVEVLIEVTGAEARRVAVLGGGEILGEMALLTGEGRSATARAMTPVTVGRISRSDFEALMQEHPEVRASVWRSFALHSLDNALEASGLDLPHSSGMLAEWLDAARELDLEVGESLDPAGAAYVFVLYGAFTDVIDALSPVVAGRAYTARRASRVILLGAHPATLRT